MSVLVVDDDFRVAGIHRELVDAHPGFVALDPARTAADAARAVRSLSPDLLLVDVYLPDGDGIELVRSSGVDAFVLSAANDAPTVRRALRAGALGYLVKPFERAALEDRLDRYLRVRNLLAGEQSLRQADIDRALGMLRPGDESSRAGRSATERAVLEALGAGAGSASDVAAALGVSRATAQRHLSALASRGVVSVALRYGATGRPEHEFRLAGPGATGAR